MQPCCFFSGKWLNEACKRVRNLFWITHSPQALIYLRQQVTGMLRRGGHGRSEYYRVCVVLYAGAKKSRCLQLEVASKERKSKSWNVKKRMTHILYDMWDQVPITCKYGHCYAFLHGDWTCPLSGGHPDRTSLWCLMRVLTNLQMIHYATRKLLHL